MKPVPWKKQVSVNEEGAIEDLVHQVVLRLQAETNKDSQATLVEVKKCFAGNP